MVRGGAICPPRRAARRLQTLLGQARWLRSPMSALPPEADMLIAGINVC
jgi:hypothetical protein